MNVSFQCYMHADIYPMKYVCFKFRINLKCVVDRVPHWL